MCKYKQGWHNIIVWCSTLWVQNKSALLAQQNGSVSAMTWSAKAAKPWWNKHMQAKTNGLGTSYIHVQNWSIKEHGWQDTISEVSGGQACIQVATSSLFNGA